MHDLDEWKNREGELIDASVFLTAKEIKKRKMASSLFVSVIIRKFTTIQK